ncbi:hypothetical protein HDV01_000856 [Terramyces sp. JEL0728]|nr:hypothetical protein HDV01_000856 [Terramyces sp. JEL0728]
MFECPVCSKLYQTQQRVGQHIKRQQKSEQNLTVQPHITFYQTQWLLNTGDTLTEDKGLQWIEGKIRLFNMINEQFKSITDPVEFKNLVDQRIETLAKIC